jgi:hypothetical protein
LAQALPETTQGEEDSLSDARVDQAEEALVSLRWRQIIFSSSAEAALFAVVRNRSIQVSARRDGANETLVRPSKERERERDPRRESLIYSEAGRESENRTAR